MNYSTHIPIPEQSYNQLVLAVGKVNELDQSKGTRITGIACDVKISRILPVEKDTPAMVEVNIRYRDLFVFWSVSMYFGIIMEKVNPQTL